MNTIHGIKGEEYNTVIAFGLLHGCVPHWENIIGKSDNGRSNSMKLLYVLCSRAKENLFLISERGRKTSSNKPYESNKELKAAVKKMQSTYRNIFLRRNWNTGCMEIAVKIMNM